ncbi:MAG: apolipoprotein N-acyltransferase, partial [Gemmatimonadales bacterium]
RGVTFLLVAANVALALAWLERARRRALVMRVGWVIAGALLAAIYGVVRERTLNVRTLGPVSVLQPNVEEKREPTSRDSAYQVAYALSAQALAEDGARLVIWPEAAVPTTFRHRPDWKLQVAAQAHFNSTPLLVGAFDIITEGGRITDYFNAAFLFDSLGESDSYPPYRKRYLVPVTERVPFLNPKWFGNLRYFGGATPGTDGPVYAVGLGRFGVLICYESIFEDLSRQYRRDGVDFLVNITNDAWFGRTSAPYQHAAHLVMRAIENRVGIARAANTGISEFVDPLGRERQRTALYTRTRVVSDIETTDAVTLYVRLGDWVGFLTVLGVFGLVGYAWWRQPRV